jgi:hypothetical protein
MTLERGTLGYAWEFERKAMLDNRGEEPLELMAKFKDVLPKLAIDSDPTGVYDVRDQGRQGSCQGQALAGIFGACFWLHTGRKIKFSAAAGYYLSQKRDGIVGDRGSTLSGGQWVATQHGMCIEDDWPYPQQYNNREPQNANYAYKLAVTKPFSRTQDLLAWIDLGLPVQIGVMWGDSCDREIVNNWQPAGGGHSTFFWFRSKSGNVRNINSWGKRWNGDGVHEWTEASIDRAIKHRYSTFIGYGPAEMIHPTPEPI